MARRPSAFSALIGLIVNCKFPRFDWTNAAKVTKNSAGVVAAVFISMALCFGGLLLTIKLPLPDPMLLPTLFTAILALACVALYLRPRGEMGRGDALTNAVCARAGLRLPPGRKTRP